jgi:phospholipid/cholesterol/gamma-HCH transport system ATP-binding protein
MMNESTEILRFHDVTIAADSEYGSGISSLSLSLASGELAVVLLEKEQVRIPLADAAEGLVTPVQGTVTFLGEDWQTMAADRAAAQRGKIGRVFEGESWLSSLNVDQNITLAQRHHTRRPVKEIEQEATQLCRAFGLPGLPRGRPSNARWQDLQRAACARAFLGAPILILLENPTIRIYADVIAPLIDTVREARQRGAAVLWTTYELQVWSNPALRATSRWRVLGSPMGMIEEAEEATG